MEIFLNPAKTPSPYLLKTHLFKSPSLRSSSSSSFNLHIKSPILRPKTLPFTLTCKLNSSQEPTNDGKNVSKKIPFSDSAPELKNEETQVKVKSKPGALAEVKRLYRKTLSILSNLTLAIGEMAAIAVLLSLGVFIEQGQSPEYYMKQFPEDNPVFGIFTWRWILTLEFDHMFSSKIFLGMLVLLAASLMACTTTTQIPMAKVARRWSFRKSPDSILKQEFSDSLSNASVQDLGVILNGAGYEVFMKGPSLYAFKGLAGRFAPIGVHLAMLMIMVGGTTSALGSYKGSVTVPQGLNFVFGDVLQPTGFLSFAPDTFNTEVHINKFSMEYYETGEVRQFYSDISLFDPNGKEVMRKTIRVNDPLRYGGITIYQTDWSLSALQILRNDEGPFNVAMAPLQINGDKKLYGTFLPVDDPDSPNVKGISMLARDMQSIVIYDTKGKFVGVRRPNSKLPIDVDGTKLEILEAIGSTGLELKTDPGVPIVYTGFAAFMLTVCISYLNHSQVWALQNGTEVTVGAKVNRGQNEFDKEMNSLLDRVPEIVVESSSPKLPDIASG